MSTRTVYMGSNVVYGHMRTLNTVPSEPEDFGWTVGKTGSGNYSWLKDATDQGTGTFGSTPLPDGSTPAGGAGNTQSYQMTSVVDVTYGEGKYAAGDWTFSFSVQAIDAGGKQDGRVNVRVWVCDFGVSSFREITSASAVGTTVTNLAVGTPQQSVATITLPAIELDPDFENLLVFQCAWEITGAGGANDADVFPTQNSNHFITSTDWDTLFRSRLIRDVFSATVTDSVAIVKTSGAILKTVSDSESTSDSVSAQVFGVKYTSISDSESTSDSVSIQLEAVYEVSVGVPLDGEQSVIDKCSREEGSIELDYWRLITDDHGGPGSGSEDTVATAVNYERYVSDATSVSDSVTYQLFGVLYGNVSDSESTSDSAFVTVTYRRELEGDSEPGNATTDSVFAEAQFLRSVTDSESASDSASTVVTFTRSLYDSESVSDLVSAQKETSGELFEREYIDHPGCADLAIAEIQGIRVVEIDDHTVSVLVVQDKLTRPESIEFEFYRTIVDVLEPPDVEITDWLSVGFDIWIDVTDSESVADAPSSEMVFARSATDLDSVTDSDDVEAQFERAPVDANATSDSTSAGLQIEISEFDSESVSDTYSTEVEFGRSDSDSSNVTDYRVTEAEFERAIVDSESVAESTARSLESSVLDSDSLSISEFVSVEEIFERQDSDAVTAADQLLRQAWLERAESESLSLSEQTTVVLISGGITYADSASSSDQVSIALEFGRNLAESVALLDQVSRNAWYEKSASDSESTSDSVGTSIELSVILSDSESTSDSVVATNLDLSLLEQVSVSDSVGREVWYDKLIIDSNSVVDEVTLINLEEYVSVSDSVLAVRHGVLKDPVPDIPKGENRVNIHFKMKYSKNGLIVERPRKNETEVHRYNVNGGHALKCVQLVGTTAEAIESSGITVGGMLLLVNLDSTNFITLIENFTSYSPVKLKPGDMAMFRSGDDILTDYKVKADTAPCNMMVLWVDE